MLTLDSWNLQYFNSGEYQVVEERLDDLRKNGILVCPKRAFILRPLRALAPGNVKVAIVGQDPYPNPRYATGIAFSIPAGERSFPPSLANIFRELSSDLHTGDPSTGDLTSWVKQGVLLWNAIPTCTAGKPGSHRWTEWEPLTREIVAILSAREPKVVFVTLGAIAQSLVQLPAASPHIHTSHPSPLGANTGRLPFLGSRLFTGINDKLSQLGQSPIDWRLDHDHRRRDHPQ